MFPEIARFTRTHAEWRDDATIEDRLVALADKVWKGRREEDLEHLVIVEIAEVTGDERWEVFSQLDAVQSFYLVTDEGRRYAIPSAEVLTKLGYTPGNATPVPANVLQLIPEGPVLDPTRAAKPAREDQ